MIRVAFDGPAVTPNQPSAVGFEPFVTQPGPLGSFGVLPVGVAAVPLFVPAFGGLVRYWLQLQNTSTSGQTIGLGTDVTVTIANAGRLLYPGDIQIFENFNGAIHGISDIAAGEIRYFVLGTQ